MGKSEISTGLMLLTSLQALTAQTAYCETFGTPDSAFRSFFPKISFEKKSQVLTEDEAKTIEEKSGEKVRDHTLTFWRTPKKDVMFLDQVLGKHEFITYAVGISHEGKVVGIEILEYRETYGQKVAEEKWRAQFIGKDKSAPLKLNTDIVNISGATLSSAHISAGVRRLLQSYDVIKNRI